MRNVFAIARKELTLYFTTPWAWLVFTAMAFLTSFFFIAMLGTFIQVQESAKAFTWAKAPPDWAPYKNLTDGVIVPVWGMVIIVTLFAGPILSMRLFSEEYRQRTFELLMTTPVRAIEIVLGKFVGGLGIVASTLGITIVYPLILTAFGSSESGTVLEWSTVLLGYGGIMLLGATSLAIGMFVSSLTESQLVAVFVSFVICLVWMLLRGAGATADEPLRSVITYVSIDTQLQNMLKGVLDVKAIIFFGSAVVFFLLLTHRAVEARRWT